MLKFIFTIVLLLGSFQAVADCNDTWNAYETCKSDWLGQNVGGCPNWIVYSLREYIAQDGSLVADKYMNFCASSNYEDIGPYPNYCRVHASCLSNGMASANASPNSQKPGLCPGSIIQNANQAVGERIPLVGVPYDLVYFSNKVKGRIADNKIVTIITSSVVRDHVTGYDLIIKDETGAIKSSTSYGPSTNQSFTYTWNGLDASSNEPWSKINYTVELTENATNHNYTKKTVVPVGNTRWKRLGLGGWVPSIWHYYNADTKTLYRGDGTEESTPYKSDGAYARVAESSDGLVHYFNSNGTISHTRLRLTGTTVYTFNYNGNGHLISIDEPFSKTTTFTRDLAGDFIGVVASNGATTTVSLNSNGYISSVTNPKSEVYGMTYVNADGLLATFTKPNSAMTTFTYDADGLLITDAHSSGNSTSLSKVGDTVSSTSAMSRVRTTSTRTYGNPLVTEETNTDPSGAVSTYKYDQQYETTTSPGYVKYVYHQKDPRFTEAKILDGMTVNDFGTWGLRLARTVTGLNPADSFDYTTQQDVETYGNARNTYVYTKATNTNVRTTKLGRTETTVIDNYERPTSVQVGSQTPVTYTYTNELLTDVAQGVRSTVLRYNATSKLLESITNPLSQITGFTYDSAQRLATQTLPDLRVVAYNYDSNGNLASITPPSRPIHIFNFGANELVSSYVPPSLSGVLNVTTTYTYNNDKQMTQVLRPDGSVINYNYHATTGMLSSITGGFGTMTPTFSSGRLMSITGYNGVKIDRNYNGTDPSGLNVYDSSTHVGVYQRSPHYVGAEGKVASQYVGGATGYRMINFGYDDDQYLTSAGALTLVHDSPNGNLTDTTLGNVTERYVYNSFGEVIAYRVKYSGTNIYRVIYTRDNLGRITSKQELINGVDTTHTYTYDVAGRLTSASDGTNTNTYSYDANSNRNGGTIEGNVITATYDDQDRMTAYRNNNFTYNANGELVQQWRTSSPNTVDFAWNTFGALEQVKVVADTIDYKLDPFQQRFVKSKNGVVVEKYIYNPEGKLVGVLDSTNALKKTFVYATKSHVPDYFIDDTGATFKIVTDHLGSVRLVVNTATGVVVQRMEHDEFGRLIVDTNPGYQPFGYAGGIYDPDTTYVLFGARTYDPQRGRWLSKDPIMFEGGDSNLYGYVLNDPVNWIDPSGLKPGDKFPTSDAAARDALEYVKRQYPGAKNEYSGSVNRNSDNSYSATEPLESKSGSSAHVKVNRKTCEGIYHSHPYLPNGDGENFSGLDKSTSDYLGVPGYLLTPSGNIKKYIPKPK